MITPLWTSWKSEDRVCVSVLFSDVQSYEYRDRGGRTEVSIAVFDNGKNLVFINSFPVVGSYIWIFIVLITMVSKHICSALTHTKQYKTVSSPLSNLLRNTSVVVLLAQHVPEIKNRSLKNLDSISDLTSWSKQAGNKVYHKSWCRKKEITRACSLALK